MKDFFDGVMKWKTGTCLLYTGAMVIYLFFCLVFNNREVSTTLLWTLLLASAAGTLIQAVCFTDWLIKRLHTAEPAVPGAVLPGAERTGLEGGVVPRPGAGGVGDVHGKLFCHLPGNDHRF